MSSRSFHAPWTGPQQEYGQVSAALVERASGPADTWTEALCQLAVAILPGVTGSGVSTYDDAGVAHPEAADDDRTLEIEQLQQVVGEGPGHAAWVQGHPVLVDDLVHETERWPGYVDAVQGLRGTPRRGMPAIAAIWSVPVSVKDTTVASLTFYYRRGPGPECLAWPDVMSLAGLAAATLTVDAEITASRPMVHGARNAVDVASGVLAVRAGTHVEEALALLRGYAFSTGRRISDVAADVSAGVIVLS